MGTYISSMEQFRLPKNSFYFTLQVVNFYLDMDTIYLSSMTLVKINRVDAEAKACKFL